MEVVRQLEPPAGSGWAAELLYEAHTVGGAASAGAATAEHVRTGSTQIPEVAALRLRDRAVLEDGASLFARRRRHLTAIDGVMLRGRQGAEEEENGCVSDKSEKKNEDCHHQRERINQ